MRPTFRGSPAAVASRPAVDAAAVDARAFFLMGRGSRCGYTGWGGKARQTRQAPILSVPRQLDQVHTRRTEHGVCKLNEKRKEEEGRGRVSEKKLQRAPLYGTATSYSLISYGSAAVADFE